MVWHVLEILLVELGWVLYEAFERRKEWAHDRCIAITMVARGHASHHVRHFNLILILRVNEGALFDLASAKQGNLVEWWAERRIGSREVHHSDISEHYVAKRICSYAQEVQVHS